MKYPQLVSMPSAVSDWLEEQLEARGIDAVVYTRYVLSLLHRDTNDLICPDHEVNVPKESSGRGRKRIRRSAYNEWWSNVRADVEQLRRSAAVECLMSASDQKCGIESLVDELCEKLKNFHSSVSENKEASRDSKPKAERIDSPLELAKRYYAAFPPLRSGTSLITQLIPHLCNKRRTKRPHKNRSNSCGDKLHRKIDLEMKSRSGGKPRVAHLSRKKDFGFTRSMEKTDSDWEVYLRNRQNRADEGYSTSDTTGVDETEEAEEKNEDPHLAKLVAKFDRKIEALWQTSEPTETKETNEYQDLPVDIQELLASPTADNLENSLSKGCIKSSSFIQCGTNITSSIWSDYGNEKYDSFCNLYNEAIETSSTDKILGDQFNYLSVGLEDHTVTENQANALYENNNKLGRSEFMSLPWELPYQDKKWSDAENYNYMDLKYNPNRLNRTIYESLLTLNHSETESCFKEVVPKQALDLPSFTISNNTTNANIHDDPAYSKDDEDLLTSSRTHFRPIKQESIEAGGIPQGQYADGTTFAIRGSLEHVNYKRSDSGTLYLESEFDTPKKYMEYRVKDANPDQAQKWDDNLRYSIEREFILKFCVKQNEKCCQTELSPEAEMSSASPQEVPAKKRVLCDPEEFFFPGDEELLCDSMLNASDEMCECNCSHVRSKVATNLEPLFNASSEMCNVHGNRSDSTLEEIGQWNNNWKKCDRCNNNWSSVWLKPEQEGIWKTGSIQSWQQIWSSSEELCRTCLGVPAGPGAQSGRSVEYFKLREELSQEGEQLLSDLSCLQRVYMEQLPITEVSCDLMECLPLGPASSTKERKRRHSSSLRTCATSLLAATAVARSSWANAHRFGPEYLMEKSPFTAPSCLRPVTL